MPLPVTKGLISCSKVRIQALKFIKNLIEETVNNKIQAWPKNMTKVSYKRGNDKHI